VLSTVAGATELTGTCDTATAAFLGAAAAAAAAWSCCELYEPLDVDSRLIVAVVTEQNSSAHTRSLLCTLGLAAGATAAHAPRTLGDTTHKPPALDPRTGRRTGLIVRLTGHTPAALQRTAMPGGVVNAPALFSAPPPPRRRASKQKGFFLGINKNPFRKSVSNPAETKKYGWDGY
jgi:hypothetical protein